jgi:hypothetical protein
MRNYWYGDHRDIVKWGVLLCLARQNQIPFILQVAYLTTVNVIPLLASEFGEVRVASEVLEHFRDIRQIAGLAALTGIQIEVFDRPFSVQSRDEYTARVIDRVRAMNINRAVVFLDPDTGISKKRASAAHVTVEEVSAIWNGLRQDDWLVVYQHALRETNWVGKQRAAFEAACSGAWVVQFLSPNGARDVAFFAASHSYSRA